ncbi:hypothetical protein AUP68_14214 [Ilyonectria robusta]
MAADQSYLSDDHYGYDVVVATTQASINSCLLEDLSQSDWPISYTCFLADLETRAPKLISLDDLLSLTNKVNPFDIPAGTPCDDVRIIALTKAQFWFGVKLQVGLPPSVYPMQMPGPVVDLTSGGDTVIYNMYCSQLSVVENIPQGGFGESAQWNVFTQTSGNPCSVQTTANRMTQDLDKDLTTAYFQRNPGQGNVIKTQVGKLGWPSFAFQQLVFDLDNAKVTSMTGFNDSFAANLLSDCFVTIYSASVKQYGQRPVGVWAIYTDRAPTQFGVTGIETTVSPLIDLYTGEPVDRPSPLEKAANTLDYLCAASYHPLPSATKFAWNWVDAIHVDMESGIMALNRSILVAMLAQQLVPIFYSPCIAATTLINPDGSGDMGWSYTIRPRNNPQTLEYTQSGDNILHIEYDGGSAPAKGDQGADHGEFGLSPTYTCDVKLSGTTMTVQQHLVFGLSLSYSSPVPPNGGSVSCNVVDKTITDVYAISIGQDGVLQLVSSGSLVQDDSQTFVHYAVRPWFKNIDKLVNDIELSTNGYTATELETLSLSPLHNSIFPCANVFTYKDVKFSAHQDLLYSITYVETSLNQIPQALVAKPTPLPIRTARAAAYKTVAMPRSLRPMIAAAPKPTGNGLISDEASNNDAPVKLTYSSEMMQNYVQGEIVSPQNKFEALQTNDGHTLLFASTMDGILNVIEEQTGQTSNGWVLTDISTAFIQEMFPDSYPDGDVRTFDAGQSALDGTMGLAMVVSVGNNDKLCLSLANSSSDTSWIAGPKWTCYPFDAQDDSHDFDSVTIVGVFFSETSDSQQYVVVDIDRSPDSSVKDIARYSVDTRGIGGKYWTRHDVPIDIEAGDYQSCVGRAAKSLVDGVYTSGTSGGEAQLVYVPITNVYGDDPPMPTRLGLPGGAVATALAAARNQTNDSDAYGTSDLYAIGSSTLYRIAAVDQRTDGTLGTPLITDDVLAGTKTLIAMTHDGVTTLWGHNTSNAVYYLSCPVDQVTVPGAWSAPLPILTGIEDISAYVNRSDGGNTIFASSSSTLQRLTQATDTPAKLWRSQDIHLASQPMEKSLVFNSYTTMLQLADANDLPAQGVNISISTETRTPVYINGLYYVLGQNPVKVPTDSAGTVTVIEATDSLDGTVLTVSTGGSGASTIINPMDKPFNKLAALDTAGALTDATVPATIHSGGLVGTVDTTPLVPSSTLLGDTQDAAKEIWALKTAYDSIGTSTPAPRPNRVVASTALFASTLPSSVSTPLFFGPIIAVALGDIYQWLKSSPLDNFVQVIKDVITDNWHVVVIVPGTPSKAYGGPLTSWEGVVGGLEWVYNKLKSGYESLIRFAGYLFGWDDIKRTKDVLHNVVKVFAQHAASSFGDIQQGVDSAIDVARGTINTWAGIQDWSSLGAPAGKPASGSASNPMEGQTSASQLFSNHFKNQASSVTVVGNEPTMDAADALLQDLITAINTEGDVLVNFKKQLEALAADFPSLTVGDVLKRLAGILVDTVLSSAQVVIDTLITIFSQLASTAIEILDTEIHIPIISDILTGIGVPSMSFLDLFTWIGAVAYTGPYMAANDGNPPFPNNASTMALITATDWASLVGGVPAVPSPLMNAGVMPRSLEDSDPPPEDSDPSPVAIGVCKACHLISGLLGVLLGLVSSGEVVFPSGENILRQTLLILDFTQGTLPFVGDWIAKLGEIEDPSTLKLSKSITILSLVAPFIFSGCIRTMFTKKVDQVEGYTLRDGRTYGAIVDVVFVAISGYCTVYHFVELLNKPADNKRHVAILGEVSNLASYVARACYFGAVFLPPPSRLPLAASIVAADAVSGGLLAAQFSLI